MDEGPSPGYKLIFNPIPETKGVITVEYNHASAAKAAKNLGYEPEDLLIKRL